MELVTVIIPTHNRKERVVRAIRSVLKQTYNNIEVIIVDDGSTDGTENEVSKVFENEMDRIIYIRQKESKGAAVARNIGITKSKGKYISFLDSDDEWKKNHIEKGLETINTNQLEGAFGWFDMVFNNKKKIPQEFSPFKNDMSPSDYVLSRIGDPRTSTFIIEEKKLKEIMFDEKLRKHQDWDLFIRFANNFRVGTITESTVIIHIDEMDSLRMSSKKNYNLEATEYFINKHKSNTSDGPLAHFYYRVSMGLLKTGGNSNTIKNYNRKMLIKGGKSYLKKYIKLSIFNLPFINIEYISDLYRKLKYR